ncbi:hypothetical protein AZJ81_06755 [Streptococcus pneumoniae]|nr:hypothetical protein AZJ81_06755 [Streptococcus pneumoniae]
MSVRKNKFFKSRDYKACLRKNSKTLTNKNKMVIIKKWSEIDDDTFRKSFYVSSALPCCVLSKLRLASEFDFHLLEMKLMRDISRHLS